MTQIKTPCIGICSTTSVGDFVCRGCKRYSFEVINWVTYAECEKQAVLSRIEQLTCQILEAKIQIYSLPKLITGLKQQHIPFNDQLSPYCWVHNLLKKGQLTAAMTLPQFGISIRPDFQSIGLVALAELVDRELISLSKAHYNRYIEGSAQLKRGLQSV